MRLSKLYIPATALLCFGYPMTTVTATLAGLPVGQINIVLKAVYASMFLLALAGGLTKPSIKIPMLTIPLFVFFILYGFRLVVDLYLRGVYAPLSSPNYTFFYFTFLTLLPAVSVALNFEASDLPTLETWMSWVLLLSAAMVFVQFQQSGTQFLLAIANERLELRDKGEVMSQLNPISIGSVGSALAIVSIARLSLNIREQGWLRLWLSAVGLVLGLGTLFLAGSRGPMLAFGVSFVLLIFGIFRTKLLRSGRQIDISNRSFILIITMIFGAVFAFQRADTMFLALGRLFETFTALGTGDLEEARTYILSDALRNFSISPLFGSGHLALDNTAYAHNSVVEALMATGLIGGVLFVANLIIVFSQAWRALSLRHGPLAFLHAPIVLSMLVLSQFSSTISQAPEIWLLVFLFLSIASRCKGAAIHTSKA